MKGVLIVAHGSRQKSAGQALEAVVEMCRAMLPEIPLESAYLGVGERDIDFGLRALAERGCGEIAVVPYFLFEGTHTRESIPEALAAFRAGHPEVSIKTARPLGADRRLAEVLAERVRECL